MSIGKFKTSPKLVNEGIKIAVKEWGNTDGTIPVFTVRRASMQNKAYAKAIRELNDKVLLKYGVASTDDLTDAQNEEIDLDVFIDAVLVGWENLEIEDGVKYEYSRENAVALFSNEELFDVTSRIKVGASLSKGFNPDLVSKITKN